MKRKSFLALLLGLILAPFVRKTQAQPTVQSKRIQQHPAFAELRKRYEWDDATDKFPTVLKNGELNPLAGVTGFMCVINKP